MIGPPGMPKIRAPHFFPVAGAAMDGARHGWRWFTGLYLAGVLAHFSHHMAFDLPADRIDPSLGDRRFPACRPAWPGRPI